MHRFPRLSLPVFIAVTCLACKSTPKPTPDRAPEAGAESTEAASAKLALFPMELPPHTAGLMSVSFARTNIVANRMITMLPPDKQPRVRREVPSAPAVHAAVVMFSDLIGEYMSIEERTKLVRHIDDKGTLHVALSLQGTREMMQAMRLGAPLSHREFVPHGVLLRISVPAKDPSALMRVLQKYATAHHIERIELVGAQVEFDMRLSSANTRRMSSRLQPIDVDTSSDLGYLSDPTPALATFLASDAGIKIHAPSATFSELAVWTGMMQAVGALQYASPEMRDTLMHEGLATASKAFALDDPTRYEVEDTTILMDLTPDEHLTMSMVRSLTPYGQKLAKKLSTPPEQPITRQPEPVFSATVSHDFGAISSDILPPRELALYNDKRQLLRDTGPLAFMAQVVQSPLSTRESTLSHVPDDISAAFFAHAFHIEASPAMDSSIGMPSPDVIIDLLLPDPVPEKTLMLESDWQSVTYGMPGSDVSFDGDHIVKMTAGTLAKDAVTTMERLHQDTFAQATLDLTLIAERLRALPTDLVRELSPTMFSELARLASVTLTATTHPTYTLWHAHTREAAPTIEIASASRDASQPSGLPDCLIPIVKASRDALHAVPKAGDPGVIHNRMISEIPAFHKTCPEARAQIDLIHARWLLTRAERAERGDLVEIAHKDYVQACELGLSIACQLHEASTTP